MPQAALPTKNFSLQPANNFVIGYSPEVLAQIYETNVQICIFNRSLDIDTNQYAVFLQTEHAGFQLMQRVILHDVKALLETSLPWHKSKYPFIGDVSMVADMFACLFGLKTIGLRLNVLNKTMCPRFHTDQVPCRLITTYAGKGTEWLDNSDETLPRKDTIKTLLAGEVALFKGKAWEDNHDSGAVHRSPTLQPDESRVLLTLDWVE